MCIIIHLRKVLEVEMRIYLRSGNVGVTQQFLYRAKIAAGLKHVTGKGMAQHVRVKLAGELLFNAPALQATLNIAVADSLTALTEKQCAAIHVRQR